MNDPLVDFLQTIKWRTDAKQSVQQYLAAFRAHVITFRTVRVRFMRVPDTIVVLKNFIKNCININVMK